MKVTSFYQTTLILPFSPGPQANNQPSVPAVMTSRVAHCISVYILVRLAVYL